MDSQIPLPPEKLQKFIGGSDFFGKFALDYMNNLMTLGNLKPYHRMLDVGCGVGRMAIPLTSYLTEGNYEGFDTHKDAIDWCKENITKKFPNFTFSLANVYNKTYNKEGKIKASQYEFPFPNEYFDFVFVSSVFTHLLPKDMENYLSEISRVLKKKGRCYVTYLLLNKESIDNIEKGKSFRNLKYEYDGYRVLNEQHHENLVGLYEESVRKLYKKYNLQIIEPIHYGRWAGRSTYFEWQDVVVAVKRYDLETKK